jgi:hypothetical protein
MFAMPAIPRGQRTHVSSGLLLSARHTRDCAETFSTASMVGPGKPEACQPWSKPGG